MSNLLRIALVAEGQTDYHFLNAAIEAMIADVPYNMKLLQPEVSASFTDGNAGSFGGGWKGVYKWCKSFKDRSDGQVQSDILFENYDILIIHLDADVASESPRDDDELSNGLPCQRDCPPVEDTTNALRDVLLSWIGSSLIPEKIAFCTPSKNLEAWVVYIFFPEDSVMVKGNWECYSKPEVRLSQQKKSSRFSKSIKDYSDPKRQTTITKNWNKLVENLSEAKLFNDRFLQCLPASQQL
jgi:hypothetical protein